MSFFKNILKLLLVVSLVAYLGYTFVTIRYESHNEVCLNVRIAIADSMRAGFINRDVVEQRLRSKGLYPKGQLMDSVHSLKIEEALMRDPFIHEAVCYKTPGGMVNILITQRIPLLRVIADGGQNYYLDETGYKMLPQGYDADLVVVTGHVDDRYAQKYLVPLGVLIAHDDFWSNQLEQIYVEPNGDVQLFTRIGDQVISAGAPTNMERKLSNLRVFYDKVLSTVGWNRYKEINIAYENQVICKNQEK